MKSMSKQDIESWPRIPSNFTTSPKVRDPITILHLHFWKRNPWIRPAAIWQSAFANMWCNYTFSSVRFQMQPRKWYPVREDIIRGVKRGRKEPWKLITFWFFQVKQQGELKINREISSECNFEASNPGLRIAEEGV